MALRKLTWILLLTTLAPALASANEPDKARWVLLLANRSGIIEALDPDSLKEQGTIRTGPMTDWVAARPDGQTLIVAMPHPPGTNGCCTLYSLDLETHAMVPLNFPAMRGVFSADGLELFVQRRNVGIDTIDLLTMARGATSGPLGKSYYLQPSPYRRWLFGVSSEASPTLDLFDLKTNSITRSIALPKGLRLTGTWAGQNYLLLGYGKGKETLWTVTVESKQLGEGTKSDLPELGGECRMPNSRATEPLFLQPPVVAGGRVFVYEGFGYKFDRRMCATVPSGGLYVLDPESGAVVGHLAPSLYFMRVVANSDGTELYAIEVGSNPVKAAQRLVRLDARTGKILAARDLYASDGMVVHETLALIYDSLIPRGEVQATVAERPAWMAACPVTKAVLDEPERDPKASPFGFGEWFISQDHKIWFPRQDWRAGQGNKVILIRPAGKRLDITGKRIDAAGPAVHIRPGDFASDYPGSTYEVIGLTFPTEGCWEITAKAGTDELRFTTTVSPGRKAVTAQLAHH